MRHSREARIQIIDQLCVTPVTLVIRLYGLGRGAAFPSGLS
jgi:hypothetical protein